MNCTSCNALMIQGAPAAFDYTKLYGEAPGKTIILMDVPIHKCSSCENTMVDIWRIAQLNEDLRAATRTTAKRFYCRFVDGNWTIAMETRSKIV